MNNLKVLKKYAGKLVEKKVFKEIKSSEEQSLEALRYLIKANLGVAHYRLNKKISQLEKKGKDVSLLWIKSDLLEYKIRAFVAGYNKEEFKKMVDLFNEIKKEAKNV